MGRLIDLFVTLMGTESGGERIKANFTLNCISHSFSIFFQNFTGSSNKNVILCMECDLNLHQIVFLLKRMLKKIIHLDCNLT